MTTLLHTLPVGTLLAGRYEIARAHAGGMGVVYLCVDRADGDRPLALKTLRPEVLARAAAREDFLQEATMWTMIPPHAHVVRAESVVRIGPDTLPYLALEYVAAPDGHANASLRSWLRPGQPLPVWRALSFALQIARGMAHAAAAVPGLVHRDLKPENVLVGRDGIAKVTDFGLALAGREAGLATLFRTSEEGAMAGAPLYMPPEQWASGAVDASADLYAFGCILYELLMGQPVASGDDLDAVQRAHFIGMPEEAPMPADWPVELTGLLRACLARASARRPGGWDDVEPVLAHLYQLAHGRPPPPPPAAAEQAQIGWRALGGTYIALGLSAHEIGRNDAAIVYLERAHELGVGTGDRALEAAALNNASLAHGALGKLAEATALGDRALAIYRALGDRRGEGGALGNLGGLSAELGRSELALSRFGEALSIPEVLEDTAVEANIRFRMAPLLAASGQLREAIEGCERAVALFHAARDRRGEAAALGTLGQLYRQAGDRTAAIERSQQALALFRGIADRTGEARELSLQGHTWVAMGKKSEAISCWDQSMKLAEEIGDRLLAASNAYNIAPCLLEMAVFMRKPAPLRNALALARSAERIYAECGRAEWAVDASRLAARIEQAMRDLGG